MKLAETQKKVNQEAEEAREFINALHEVAGNPNPADLKDPAEPVKSLEAGVETLPERLQYLWDEQWDVLGEAKRQQKHTCTE